MAGADERITPPLGYSGTGQYVFAGGLWRPLGGVDQGDGTASLLVSGAGITPTATSVAIKDGASSQLATVDSGGRQLVLDGTVNTAIGNAATQAHADATQAHNDQLVVQGDLGGDGASPPSIPGTGVRGWLRSVYDTLVSILGVLTGGLLGTRPKMLQVIDANNTFVVTNTGATNTGGWTHTRSAGVARILTVLASDVSSGLGGTFTFQFSEDGTNPTISEQRTITDFSTVRDFDLINAGEYYRTIFTPSRALTSSEHVFGTTTLRLQNDGAFVRLASQQIEEANAAMPQTFAYLKGFDPRTGKSVNIRPDETGSLRVRDTSHTVSASGSLFTETVRDDVALAFSRTAYATGTAGLTAVTGQVGTFSQNATEGRVVFSTGAGTNRVAWYRSSLPVTYKAAHEIVGDITMYVPALTGTAEARWGFMEDNGSAAILNGLGWGLDATGLFIWRIKNSTEVTKVYSTSFNRDKLNGVEPSLFRRAGVAVAFQPTMNTLYRIAYEWLGISPPLWGVQSPERPFIDAHVDETSNSQTGTTIPEPSLSLAVRLFSGNVAAGITAESGSWRGGLRSGASILTGKRPDGSYSDVSLLADSSLPVGGQPLTLRLDQDSQTRVIYIGKAAPGASDTDAASTAWTIYHLSYTGGNTTPDSIKYATSVAWPNRATSVTYS